MDRKIIIAMAIAVIVVIGIVGATLLFSNKASGSVYYITLAPSNMKAALASGQIDAYIAWEPYVSDSVVGGVGEILLLSEDMMPNHPCCVVAVSNDFLGSTDGTELSERFLKAHMDATDWMVDALENPEGENYTLLVSLAMDFTLRNESVVKAALDHMIYGYAMGATFTSALEEFTQMYIDTNLTTDAALEEQG
ncbi:MAG: ABC transporter substrate-binding protein, partial [Thermoplasmata archaeon]|nr:ABC transporter substrate-binding protein [Thermoplasmata archaeon]